MINSSNKIISILGCGWFGMAFAKRLIELGFTVKGSTTTPAKLERLSEQNISPYLINFDGKQITCDESFFDADVLFICIPPKRASPELKHYPNKVKSILKISKGKSKKVILISSTSVFGDENKTVNELSETRPDTDSGKMVLDAEQIIKSFHPKDCTVIRFSGLFGPDRNPGRFFAGKKDVPNGLVPVNLIHQFDAVGVACAILEKEGFGRTYNACAPEHPTKQDFYKKAAEDAGLEQPSFIEEKRSWKLVTSINVPKLLSYEFKVKL